uniref:Ground-like domain-containing protein n=1 Tax=Meloidogyne incognita TaxID=6306 RepID=A0A914MFK1_MELIC
MLLLGGGRYLIEALYLTDAHYKARFFSDPRVICAKGEFSYVAYTDTFCQSSLGNVTCYAYRSLGLESTENIIKTTTMSDVDLL